MSLGNRGDAYAIPPQSVRSRYGSHTARASAQRPETSAEFPAWPGIINCHIHRRFRVNTM